MVKRLNFGDGYAAVDVSKWKKVDAGAFGVSRAMISLPSWTVLKILRKEGTCS